jgi:DNA-binding transcriptional LysR family regulator
MVENPVNPEHIVPSLVSIDSPLGVFHLVFPTRRGLLPSVRAFIDFLTERMPRLL